MNLPDPQPSADILLVDDTPDNLRLLTQTLSEHGYQVRAVTSGQRAVESAQSSPPDLVLLDIRMPEMDGIMVCERLKQDPRTRDIPVIFISAIDEIEDKVRAFAAGGVDYVTKPFQVEEVLARTQTHLALRRLQRRLEEVNQRFERELLLAAKMQASFLPRGMPEIPGWELAADLRPARETSGDFYSLFRLPQGRIGILIADVVDKGVPAALLMAMSLSIISAHAEDSSDAPDQVLRKASASLIRHVGGGQFVAVFYGVLQPSTGRLTYCNAGHPAPILIRCGDSPRENLALSGPPIGLIEDAEWTLGETEIARGECLVLFTDGVTDAESPAGDFFDRHRLEALLAAGAPRSATQLTSAILAEVETFVAGAPQFDDMALMVVRRQ